jgi:hypothetical protein
MRGVTVVEISLERFAYSPMGTFGRFRIGEEFSCFTVERPWEGNKPNESCIPEGEYILERAVYHRGGYACYEVMAVPGRSLIKIHIANTMLDVYGCIGLGRALGFIDDLWAVKQSKLTFALFMDTMDGAPQATLNITHYELGRSVRLRSGTV